jgi:serine/threonine-protein kinase RsbW
MADRPLGGTDSNPARHTLPATPDSIPTIRHQLDRVLDSLDIPPARGADIRLALTEACTNAVQHAYPRTSPPADMVVGFHVSPEALTVTVTDSGGGIDGPSPNPGLGVGLRLIKALADALTIEHLHPGTSVRMTFQR